MKLFNIDGRLMQRTVEIQYKSRIKLRDSDGARRTANLNWYHLLANNMAWAEDLLRYHFQTHLNGWP